MATANTTSTSYHSILTYMVQTGGTKVAKALAKKRIEQLIPNGQDPAEPKVDAFLKQNMQTILSCRAGRDNEWRYFPVDSSPTDFDNWDLNATVFILLETCKLGKEIRMYLVQLRKLRNKLVHLSSTNIEEPKFEYYKTKVSVILSKFLSEIGDEHLAKDIDDMHQQIADGSIFQNTKQPTTHDENRKVLEKSANFDTESTEQKLETTIQLLQRLEPAIASDNPTMEVPDIGVQIVVKNCNKGMAVNISQHMVDIFNDVIYEKFDDFKELSNEYRHNMREAVYETCMIFLSNGRPVYKAEVECVVLHIRCISLVALLILFRDYIHGILDENLQVLESAVRRCNGYENTSLEMTIYRDEFWDILSKIAVDLEKYVSIKEKQHQVPQRNGKTRTVAALSVPETLSVQSKDGMEDYMKQHSSPQEHDQHEYNTPGAKDDSEREKLPEHSQTYGADSTEYIQMEDSDCKKTEHVLEKDRIQLQKSACHYVLLPDFIDYCIVIPELPSEISTKENQHMLNISDGKDQSVSALTSVPNSLHIKEKEGMGDNNKHTSPQEQVQSEHDTSRTEKELLPKQLKTIEADETDTTNTKKDKEDDPSRMLELQDTTKESQLDQKPLGRLNTGSIDFGTLNTGWAWSSSVEPKKIHTSNWISEGTTSLECHKVPTAALFDRNEYFCAFGFDAEEKYQKLLAKGCHQDWYYFQNFRKEISTNKLLSADTKLKDVEGKEMSAMAVTAGVIRHLKEMIMKDICKKKDETKEEDVCWVLTVPIKWPDDGNLFMEKAAIQAGLRNVKIIPEPEASKSYCETFIYNDTDRIADQHPLSTDLTYLLADLGGEETNISVYHIEDGSQSTTYYPMCEESGGNTVNLAFRRFLESLFGEEAINQFRLSAGRDCLDFFREFEIRKRKVNADPVSSITFKCPASLGECLLEKRNMTLQSCITEKGLSNDIDAKTDKMRISPKLVKELFDGPVEKIVKSLTEAIRRSEYEIKKLVLVGGFSESLYVKQRISAELETEFPNIEIIQPQEASLHLMKGAIIFMNRQL